MAIASIVKNRITSWHIVYCKDMYIKHHRSVSMKSYYTLVKIQEYDTKVTKHNWKLLHFHKKAKGPCSLIKI